MDWFRWILLESPAALAALLALALFFLLVHWRRTLQARPLLVGLGLAVALLALQAVVVTPRERFVQMMLPVQRAVLQGDVDALGRALTPDFVAGDMDKPRFLDFARTQLNRVRVSSLRRLTTRVTPTETATDAWHAIVGYSGAVTTADWQGQLVTASWDIWFHRAPDGTHRITRIEPRRINGQEIGRWATLELLR